MDEEQEKRKLVSCLGLDELNEDVLEGVLSWLPTSSFVRLTSVCKRWKSVADSASFRAACSRVPARDPWFFMVGPHLNRCIVFDTTSAEKNWKSLNYPHLLHRNSIPVAASGGLLCFRNIFGGFVVSNPVTGACRELPPPLPPSPQTPLRAIAMNSDRAASFYRLVLLYGDLPNLSAKIYDSGENCWGQDIPLLRSLDPLEPQDDDHTLYFLSKAGEVVVTNMQRSPSNQYSSVITLKEDGQEIINFLSSSGTIVACNLVQKCFLEYPRLLPLFLEYSIDVVECRGELLVVVLSEFLETATLRVWSFSDKEKTWIQVAAMPPSLSHEFYGKKADINCVGSGDRILMCVMNSTGLGSYVLCDLVSEEWIELPKYCVNGEPKEFMSAFSFEPRIEACV